MCKEIFFKQIIFITFFMMILSKICGQTDDKWRVWVKVSPCSGRFDWITVAKDNPTNGGLSFYNRADIIFPGTKCTVFGCTFAAANDVANSLKPSDVFFDYCCRDFSVWENSTTKEKSIVVGKFGTAGVGWLFIKGDLCCEEAELLAGISGACSGTSNNNNNTVRSKPDCDKYYKNSIAQWDPATNQYQCYCAQGFTWNATRTECISTSIPDCDKYYKNSIAQWDPATNQYQCYCAQGFSWNAARTECISTSIPDCDKYYKNSIAQWDPATNQYQCYCAQGFTWNATRTECVSTSIPDCDKYYKNSIAQWDPATNQYQCYCAQGFTWNAARTECISTSIPDCDKYYKNSIAQWDPATNQYQCYCAQGFSWNAARTECVSISIPDCPSIYKNSIAQWDPATNQYLCYCAQGYEWNSSLNQCVLLGNGDRENPRVNAQQQKIGQCNIEYKSGANEPEQYTIDVKSNIGSVLFSYSTFTVKDRIHIYQSGTKIFDSGCIGASGSQVLKLNGSSSIFVIVVDPLCSPGETSDTAWNFTLGCPY
ncbi:MAG: hypothetical protein IPL55_14020 [Saprospiraceae bacterium]|nr:hypothetical protein [Saprospiraceae bacterium]